MEYQWVIAYLMIGAMVGFMAGLLGIGGGGILVPILVTIFIKHHVPNVYVMHLALGTSMACISVTSLSSMRAHHKRGSVNWELAKTMAPGMVIGTFLATFIASLISTKGLAIFFSLFMAYVSFQMFSNRVPSNRNYRANEIELIGVSSIIGIISALVSIGGGSLTVPYLNWRGFELKTSIGTSAALGFPIAIAGSMGYLINGLQASIPLSHTFGFVYLPAAILISATSYFTAPVGAKLAHKLPTVKLKKVFGCLLILLSLKMLFSIL